MPDANFTSYVNRQMLPTPSTSHVDFDRVYEPAEDSFLLLDTLASPSETAFLSQRFASTPSPIVLEVGTGSGVVLAFVAAWANRLFGRRDVLTLGIDVNRFACLATSRTVQTAVTQPSESDNPKSESAIFGAAVMADLTSCMRANVVDVLIFNPPYVPTEDLPNIGGNHTSAFERDSHMLALSYAGGLDGMETTNRLLEELSEVMQPERGVAYVLLCAQNKPEEVKARIRSWEGRWSAETVGWSGKQAGWEKLQIVRIWPNSSRSG